MIELPRKAKGERPSYFEDGTLDSMLSMLLALAGEVVVLRERLDSAERIIDGSGLLTDRIDAYRPSPEVAAKREALRAQFIDLVMRPVQQEYENLQEKAARQESYDKAIDLCISG
ncbi:hypothetical protein [Novosphingobium sp. UBA1939]|uniref:hypothetical protein n=1 Tax=Novosphingobium sp. UBA1939 TaxID=1946982 RepID=UPI0025D5E2A5|nr:hypothetical protein [Novosphingobium sp. UBA1939]